jgi:vacuolar-type H+-ATPase subunit I/STV1
MVEREQVSNFFLSQQQELDKSINQIQGELNDLLDIVNEKKEVLAQEKERRDLLIQSHNLFNQVYFPSLVSSDKDETDRLEKWFEEHTNYSPRS